TEPGEFLQSPTSVGPVVRHGVHREAQRHRPPSRFHVKHDEHGPHEHGLSGCERQDMAQARELSATYRALVDRTRGHWVAQRLLNSLTRGLHPVIAERVGSKQGGKNCRESLHQSSSLAAYLPWPIFSRRSSFLIHRNTVSRTGAASQCRRCHAVPISATVTPSGPIALIMPNTTSRRSSVSSSGALSEGGVTPPPAVVSPSGGGLLNEYSWRSSRPPERTRSWNASNSSPDGPPASSM